MGLRNSYNQKYSTTKFTLLEVVVALTTEQRASGMIRETTTTDYKIKNEKPWLLTFLFYIVLSIANRIFVF